MRLIFSIYNNNIQNWVGNSKLYDIVTILFVCMLLSSQAFELNFMYCKSFLSLLSNIQHQFGYISVYVINTSKTWCHLILVLVGLYVCTCVCLFVLLSVLVSILIGIWEWYSTIYSYIIVGLCNFNKNVRHN